MSGIENGMWALEVAETDYSYTNSGDSDIMASASNTYTRIPTQSQYLPIRFTACTVRVRCSPSSGSVPLFHIFAR